VHGKKASVITFGPDWHNMPAEERLKVRKQAQEAVQESGEDSAMSEAEKDPSIMSGGAAPALSDGGLNGDEEVTPRPSTTEKRNHPQRHVSSQTITGNTSNTSINGETTNSRDDSDDEAVEMKAVPTKNGRVPKHDHSLSESNDSEPEHPEHVTAVNGPKTQAVEA